jgi:hypothetical protein
MMMVGLLAALTVAKAMLGTATAANTAARAANNRERLKRMGDTFPR